nr:NUDIX hydrolase N-terminal domain-containing protein [Streptococcus ruminantium]
MVGMGSTSASSGTDGSACGKDVYDIERFEEIRSIAAEMLAESSGQPL